METNKPNKTDNCVTCNKPAKTKCVVCKAAFYCSAACQKIDWSVHKTLCKAYTTLDPRPDERSKLAILLPADSPDPRLVWVPCNMKYDDHVLDLKDALGEPKLSSSDRVNISKNVVRHYELDHTLVLNSREDMFHDGSKPNQAALALTNWKLPYDWRGNVIFANYKGLISAGRTKIPPEFLLRCGVPYFPDEGGNTEPGQEFQDVTFADLRTAVDHLTQYGTTAKRGQEALPRARLLHTDAGLEEMGKNKRMAKWLEVHYGVKKRPVKGVTIRCEGDIRLNQKKTGKWDRYIETDVSKDHPIWSTSPTPASIFMGLPLLVCRLPHSDLWDDGYNTHMNQPATYLNLSVDPKNSNKWGYAPAPQWQNGVGNALVVRLDSKDLSREQAWAISEYMQFRVSGAFAAVCENEGGYKERRATVLKMLNWESFESFLEKFKVEQTSADGKSWMDVKSPFGNTTDRTLESVLAAMNSD